MKKYFLLPLLVCLALTTSSCGKESNDPIPIVVRGDVVVNLYGDGRMIFQEVEFISTPRYDSDSSSVTIIFGVKSQSVHDVSFSDNTLGEELTLPLPINRTTKYNVSCLNDTIVYKISWDNNEVIYKCYRYSDSDSIISSYRCHNI